MLLAMSESGFDRASTLELLAFSDDLPSLPDRFVKIQKVAQNPDSGAKDLADIIKSDQATSAMVLKFANSPAFNPSNQSIGELSTAIARLGSHETVHIATAMSLMYGMVLPTGMANIRSFWAHAYAVALVCQHIAHQIDPAEKRCSHDRAFMTGLLHDIGRAAFGMRVDFSYFERDMGHLCGEELIQAEEAFYGVHHGEAGKMLLQLWLFPDDLCDAVAQHHNPNAPELLGRICYAANAYVNQHLPERAAFETVHALISEAIKKSPPEPPEL